MTQEILLAFMLLTAVALIASGVYLLVGTGYALVCAGSLLLVLTIAALRGSANK